MSWTAWYAIVGYVVAYLLLVLVTAGVCGMGGR